MTSCAYIIFNVPSSLVLNAALRKPHQRLLLVCARPGAPSSCLYMLNASAHCTSWYCLHTCAAHPVREIQKSIIVSLIST